VSATHSVPKY